MKYVSLQCRRMMSKLCQQELHRSIGCFNTCSLFRMPFCSLANEAVTDNDTRSPPTPSKKVPCPEDSKLMKIAIIGVPNAGKSTIINSLTNYEVCPVSRRPHTTRKNQKAVYLDNKTQLVFVDTPGLVNVKEIKKFSFTEEFVYGPEKSIGSSHVIAVIHDASNAITCDKLDFRIKRVLEKFPDKKSILILNKIDAVKRKSVLLDAVKYLTSGIVGGKPIPMQTFEQNKESHKPLDTETILARAKQRYVEERKIIEASTIEETVETYATRFFTEKEVKNGIHQLGWPKFDDIFMISALEGDGIDLLREYMLLNAIPHDWLYDDQTLTDVSPTNMVLSILRAKLLEHLPQEIPFKVVPVLEFWQENDEGTLCIYIKLNCPKERYQWRIIGTGGALLNRIVFDTEKIISSLLDKPVKLTVNPVFDKHLANKMK